MTEPTYDDYVRYLDATIDAFTRSVRAREGEPGVWRWYATVHEGRLRCWRSAQRAHMHGVALGRGLGCTCTCGLERSANPHTDADWRAFFAAPGHLDAATDDQASWFIADGGPFHKTLWCAVCGPGPSVMTDAHGGVDRGHLRHLMTSHGTDCAARFRF